MNYEGLSKKDVLRLLNEYLKEDLTYKSGRILGSMCTSPHAFAKRIFIKAIDKNLGDAGLFPGTMKLEQEAISM
ncbi:MAG: hypothetical protein QXL46_04140, partial [Nitrososphaerales archaeon]